MALRPLESEGPRLRRPHADIWRTLSAWLWTTYFTTAAAAILWWVL